MNANEIADELNKNAKEERQDFWSDESGWCDVLEKAAIMLRQQQALIENLNGRIDRMIEKQSHYEAMAHAGGFEAGRQLAFFDRAREVAKKIDKYEYHTPED